MSVFQSTRKLKRHVRLLNSSHLLPSLSFCSLDAVDPNAYDAFKASRNLGDVVDRVLRNQQEASNGSGPRKLLTVEASLMTPVQPMLVRQYVNHYQLLQHYSFSLTSKSSL